MLHNTNIVVFVGGGDSPLFPKHYVVIWDDLEMKVVGYIEFPVGINIGGLRITIDK